MQEGGRCVCVGGGASLNSTCTDLSLVLVGGRVNQNRGYSTSEDSKSEWKGMYM